MRLPHRLFPISLYVTCLQNDIFFTTDVNDREDSKRHEKLRQAQSNELKILQSGVNNVDKMTPRLPPDCQNPKTKR